VLHLVEDALDRVAPPVEPAADAALTLLVASPGDMRGSAALGTTSMRAFAL